MASDKKKILEKAQYYIQKGSIEKAIREYEKVVELDSHDIRSIQRLGDLYSKKDMTKKAIEAFKKAAALYQNDGFYLKAVAVLKNILKLDAAQVGVHATLGDLYYQLNIFKDAMEQYQLAISTYEQQGKSAEALNVMRRMIRIDSKNYPSRIRIAEHTIQQGLKEEGIKDLSKLAEELKDADPSLHIHLINALEKLLSYSPERVDAIKQLAKTYILQEAYQKAADLLSNNQTHIESNLDCQALMAQALAHTDDRDKALELYRDTIQQYATQGNTEAVNKLRLEVEKIDPHADFLADIQSQPVAAPPVPESAVEEAIVAEMDSTIDEPVDVNERTQKSVPVAAKPAVNVEEEVVVEFDQASSDLSVNDVEAEFEDKHESIESSVLSIQTPAQQAQGPVEDLSLGEDLEKELAGWDPGDTSSQPVSFEEVFDQFKKGVESQLGEDEASAHHDLGIAYREMGLLDDAINEFKLAAQDQDFYLSANTMLGHCHQASGKFKEALASYQMILEHPALPAAAQKETLYQLGLCYVALEQQDEALKVLQRLQGLDPNYKDAAVRINQLSGQQPTENYEALSVDDILGERELSAFNDFKESFL